jgi:putative acetyltransferase
MIVVRRSIRQDGPHVFEIWRRAVDATHDFLSAEDRRDIEVSVSEFLPKADLWLASQGHGSAVGFMMLSGAHMDALFVHPDYHGIGVGRALVEHARRRCLVLTTDVNEQNEQAVGFYRRLGFTCIGRSAFDHQGRPYPLLHLRIE